MRNIETDYLVVGAGTSGMGFTDVVLSESDAEVVMVDRQARPGGHWLGAYPFVRLHQPSATYGVNSTPLGRDRIDEHGPNAGFYERASAPEICDYFRRVLEDVFLPSGRVTFLGMSDYCGPNGDAHVVVSRLTGEQTSVKVRRKFVDATYTESSIPSRHKPSFTVDDAMTVIPPNDLVDLQSAPAGFTVIGAGKTASDTCNWLLDSGVDPDRIEWIRPRDPWLFNREYNQPLELVGSYMYLQEKWVEAAAAAESGEDFAHRMADAGVFMRIDPAVEPELFRGATISQLELDALRSIENVNRGSRVKHIGTERITIDNGELAAHPERIYVDCTAAGLNANPPRPIFEPGRITMQLVQIGFLSWSAGTIGVVEAMRDDDSEKNRLCPPVHFSGRTADILDVAFHGMTGLNARMSEPDINAWNDKSRLNPVRDAPKHFDDPRVSGAFTSILTNIGPAMENLERRVQRNT